MRKLTLDEAWKLCMRQWRKGVIPNCVHVIGIGESNVNDCKRKWTEKNGFDIGTIKADCFFCEYDAQQTGGGNCSKCPGRLVDPEFRCQGSAYDYDDFPFKFYAELERLYIIHQVNKE